MRINGRAYDFILDTGGYNILTPQTAAELGLTVEGEGTSGGSGPGRVAEGDTNVAELTLGSATMTNQHFFVLDLVGVKRKAKPPIGGMIGLETFERMTITIDKPRGHITIEQSQPRQACGGDTIPLLFDIDQPSAAGKIDGIPGLIGIDAGNAGLAVVLWRWAEAHKVSDRFRGGSQAYSVGIGGSNAVSVTKHHEIVVGRTPLRDIEVAYSTAQSGYFSSRTDAANVGRTLLDKFVVRFDYPHGRMCVIPPS